MHVLRLWEENGAPGGNPQGYWDTQATSTEKEPRTFWKCNTLQPPRQSTYRLRHRFTWAKQSKLRSITQSTKLFTSEHTYSVGMLVITNVLFFCKRKKTNQANFKHELIQNNNQEFPPLRCAQRYTRVASVGIVVNDNRRSHGCMRNTCRMYLNIWCVERKHKFKAMKKGKSSSSVV